MDKLRLLLIVEGVGETKAAPELVRRWCWSRGIYDVEIDPPIRASGKGALTSSYDANHEFGVEYYVDIASRRRHDALLILLDADDDCPMKLGRSLLARASKGLPKGWPVGVVAAKRMYESWFLAALGSDEFRQGLVERKYWKSMSDVPTVDDVEKVVSCKDKVASHILNGAKYEPTTHQTKLTSILPFDDATAARSRSFRKLLKELDALLGAARGRGAV